MSRLVAIMFRQVDILEIQMIVQTYSVKWPCSLSRKLSSRFNQQTCILDKTGGIGA